MLTKNKRTHYVLVKEGNGNNVSRIPITNSQYELYKEEISMKKHNDLFEIHDIDTDELLFDGRANKIEGFQKIKTDNNFKNTVYICGYGTRHSVLGFPDNCLCKNKFKTTAISFKSDLKELGYNIFYDSDITLEMQEHYLKSKVNG